MVIVNTDRINARFNYEILHNNYLFRKSEMCLKDFMSHLRALFSRSQQRIQRGLWTQQEEGEVLLPYFRNGLPGVTASGFSKTELPVRRPQELHKSCQSSLFIYKLTNPPGSNAQRFTKVLKKYDRLCGLVVRVSGYRYRGLGFDSRRYQIF